MNLLNYSLTAIVSYLGLVAGFILAVIAKEELKDGKKYFILLQKIILLLVFVFLLAFIKLNYMLVLLVLVFIAAYIAKKEYLIYAVLGAVFYLSSRELDLFAIESSLIFLYGLPTGTLFSYKTKREAALNILKNALFILAAIASFSGLS